jgi:uncharacterized protein (DUF1684 family)/pimeloyl-ACP methyl ester carboxylesterase
MKPSYFRTLTFLSTLLAPGNSWMLSVIADDEIVTIYASYGYLEEGEWKIPMRIRVSEPRGLTEALTSRVARSLGGLSTSEVATFRSRFRTFLSDSESREIVTFQFDQDDSEESFTLKDASGKPIRSDLNGIIEGILYLSAAKATALLDAQQSQNGWLSLRATSAEHTGGGWIQLIPPEGVSVISDIDDTIRITELLSGMKTVVRNTFFRDFVASPGMPDRYSELSEAGAAFHYVSGGPWQLYEPLAEFISEDNRYPRGSLHMKSISKNLRSASTWRDLAEVLLNDNATFDQKSRQIRTIVRAFPQRRFILIGDSGEADPEIYRTIRDEFPDQIQEIWIRDVAQAAVRNPDRLAGMQVIPVASSEPVPTTSSDWHGFQKHSFDVSGHPAFVVVPKTAAHGNPWIWRTSFPDFHPEVDLELLKRGFHVGHIDVVAMLGSDSSLDLMDQFYDIVQRQWDLADRPALEPCSRGGLHAYRYAARHPDRVACIFADTPVMDLKSWPLKAGAEGPLMDALRYYPFASEDELRSFQGNPIDLLEPMAKARIPIRHVVSPNDTVVPPEENSFEARRRLQTLGWDMDIVLIDPATSYNGGHHFPVIEVDASTEFVVRHASVPLEPDQQSYEEEVSAWRADNERRLTAPYGWLSLTGHYWLHEGENVVSADENSDIRLPSDPGLSPAGSIHVDGQTITLNPSDAVRITVNDKSITAPVQIAMDPLTPEADSPDRILVADRIQLQLVRRSNKLAVRVRDPLSERLTQFRGKTWFPIQPAFRIEANFTPYQPTQRIQTANVKGELVQMELVGLIEFELAGQSLQLEAAQETPDELFIVFRDKTGGVTTYSNGRFLSAADPVNGKVILDFNKAWNPPCAFSPHTLCPLPPRKNSLPIDIPAGEMNYVTE